MVGEKMICSSIAMLQERFRQLEKVKEMREERELLKLISYNNNNHHHSLSPAHSFDHSLFAFPTPKHYLQDSHDLLSLSLSLSLWQHPHMNKKMKYDTYWDEIQSSPQKLATKPSWLAHASPPLIKNINEADDVDTTLHL